MPGQPAGTGPGEAVLAEAVAAYHRALGSRLVAGYALGSLAHGGFSPLVSDVDLGLILADPLRRSDRWVIRRVATGVRAGGSPLHQRLSVFWGTPASLGGQRGGGRFPPLDRLDLLEHGRLLAGRDTRDVARRPGRDELLVAGAEFALGHLGGPVSLPVRLRGWARSGPRRDQALADIRDPARLAARGPQRVTKVVLFPVRFRFTADTGRVGTNPLAVEHYLADAGAPAAELVAAALAWRRDPPPAGEAVALLRRDLIPLYTGYIDAHLARLDARGQRARAGRFRRWRARLDEVPPLAGPPG